jgi:hypothetical protein
MKFILPDYFFVFMGLGNELWIFEVHSEVHQVHPRSRVTSRSKAGIVKERLGKAALRRGDVKRFYEGWEEACSLKLYPKRFASLRVGLRQQGTVLSSSLSTAYAARRFASQASTTQQLQRRELPGTR